ncbi:CD209 antigen-like [Carlito syrichta]|uniref:CD209 antigen-like n=1 Tax=Carlito syrichta TaxID=1868482 RepID=A0A1U7T161_CARSF|nr:CD209 antigen-like [Carlito syrichta]
MSDSKEPRAQQLGLMEEEELMTSNIRSFPRHSGFPRTRGFNNLAGRLGHVSLVLWLLSFILFAGLLMAILVKVSKPPNSLSQEQQIFQELAQLKTAIDECPARSKQQEISQELAQLKTALNECPARSKQQEISQELAQLKTAINECPARSKQQEISQELAQLKTAIDECPARSKQQEISQELAQLKTAIDECPARSKQQEISQELAQLKTAINECPARSKQQEISQELAQLKTAVGKCKQPEIAQEVAQLKVAVNHLCRPCPWDWTFFQGNCYFISNSQRNWQDSITACQEVGAQLVVIKSHEEQNFLQLQSSRSNRFTWMGLSDLKTEGTWHWVDGSLLSPSFAKYWNRGEPNNVGKEDCAEFSGNGWNDDKCAVAKFWVCKKPAASCPHEEGWFLSSTPAVPSPAAG